MLLDANVLLCAVDRTYPPHAPAAEWLTRALTGLARIAVPWRTIDAFVRISNALAIVPEPIPPAPVEVEHVGDVEHHVVAVRAEPVPHRRQGRRREVDGGQVAVTALAQVVDQRRPPGADVDDRVGHFDARRVHQAQRQLGDRLPPRDPVHVLVCGATLPERIRSAGSWGRGSDEATME